MEGHVALDRNMGLGYNTVPEVKKIPWTSNISIRTSIYFHPMSDGQVKKYSARLYFLECSALFGDRTTKNLGVLVWTTSEHLKIFLPTLVIDPRRSFKCISK